MASHPEITKEDIRQMKGCENMEDEMADRFVLTIKTLCEILYESAAENFSDAEIPDFDKIIPIRSNTENKAA